MLQNLIAQFKLKNKGGGAAAASAKGFSVVAGGKY
jgi:hypothetical protein